MRVRRLVRARADAVADRVRRLAGIADRRDPLADQPVELGEARARPAVGDRLLVDAEQPGLELAVLGPQLARAEQLRVVGPVAVGADPDLEQRRLVGRTGRSPVAVNVLIPGPDQTSEKPSARSTLPCQPVPSPWTKPCQIAAAWLSFIPGRSSPRTCSIAAAQISFASRMRSISCGVLIARAAISTGLASSARGPGVEPRLRERRRLTDHPVGRLRAERELEPDSAVVLRCGERRVERARRHGPWIVLGVALDSKRTSLVQAERAASSADASRQSSTGSPSRGNTHAS